MALGFNSDIKNYRTKANMNQAALFEFLKSKNSTKILVVADEKEAKQAKVVYDYLDKKAFVLPDIRLLPGDDTRSYLTDISKAFSALKDFHKFGSATLIAPFRTLTFPLPKAEYLKSLTIDFGDNLNLEELKQKLYHWGYNFVDVVSAPTEVSFRGDIIDIFPSNLEKAVRVSLFDSEVEELRYFDVSTQKREKEELDSIEIAPAFLALNAEEFESLQDRVERCPYDSFVKDVASLGLWTLANLAQNYLKEYEHMLARTSLIGEIEEFYSLNSESAPLIEKTSFNTKTLNEPKEYRELEVININKIIESHKDKKITIISRNESQVRASTLANLADLEFKYIDGILNIASDSELILSLNKEQKRKRVKKPTLILDEIKIGEYVVHENYGVGIFKGIEKREVLGRFREFVAIEYQGEDMLYIPVENLEVIDRYVASSGTLPALDKLGKASFAKLKSKVKEKLFAIARQLMEISAKRALQKGIKIVVDRNLQQAFLNDAGFTHTADQLKAIEDMLDELSSGRIMDRLLSADVGFGKTEVAMNALFAVVKNGYQGAIIAPTTLLSSQHFKSLKERLEKWDIKVGKLDRFTTPKNKKAVIEGLANGTLDVVVGTHALLGTKFKNLALVVIDEEHKFGVKQKEALKELTINTHLLSMSATPIPRSLNMAMSQIKTFSEIFTPPVSRKGVRTFVKNYDIKAVAETIRREIRRGGQVFYVYNSIAAIEDKKRALLEEMPDLRLTVLHSKISATVTEKEMLKFEQGEYDVLLSTSIVESGIHMPNANTIIIDGAQNFGIADLHQLRGRVGRGSVEGYCYYFVSNKDELKDNAKKRLLALESHSDLGSGAVLAMHDLEIRGGGNLIGEAQSGHIKQIGYSLYLKMLEDAIRTLSGKAEESKGVELKLSVDAYLSDELITEDRLRLELYRRLSQCSTIQEVYEIEEEIEDRFGKLDKMTKQFIDLMVVKVLANEKNIKKVSSYEQRVFVEFNSDKERVVLNSPTKDSDDVIATALGYLRG